MNETKPNLNDWTDFAGDFLKCDLVKEFPLLVVCKDVDGEISEGKPKMWAVIEYLGKTWKIGLNKTNQTFVRSANLTPRGLIGKKLTFEKIKVRDPTKNTLVDSFLLTKIE